MSSAGGADRTDGPEEGGGPVRYSKELARRWGRPTAPCEICGGTLHPRVRDHCHAHGWVRGVVCNFCNGLLSNLDRGARPPDHALLAPLAAYVALWLRCPDCAVVGWAETAYCACDHAGRSWARYDCTRPASTPPCPWWGTGFRPATRSSSGGTSGPAPRQ